MKIAVDVGLQHCGCLGTAMAFADAIADAGADIYKAQCHLGDTCNQFRHGTESYFPQDGTRRAYWNRTAFWVDHWVALAHNIRKRGLLFSCSVFSLAGLEMMAPLCDQIKIPSSKTNDHELLRAAAATGKPVVLSTGMSDREEADNAADCLEACRCRPTVLQCVSEYPTPPEHIDLHPGIHWNPWGLSDHSGTIFPGLIAAWEGADMLEVHVCWSKEQWGPDVSSSLTIDELRQLVQGVRFVEKMRDSRITKDELAAQLSEVRKVFRS